MTKSSSSKMPKAASEEKPYEKTGGQHHTAAVSETAAYYQPQPYLSIPEPCSLPKTAAAILQQTTIPQHTATPQQTTITVIDSGKTQEEIMLSESPIYPNPARYWTDRDELLRKRTLEHLLTECRRVPVLAAYLNCTRDQIYKAMRHHGIKRPAYISYTYHDFLMKKPQQNQK